MTGRIPRLFIDDLLQRIDIVDLVDSFVPLKKAGSNFVARCPFHNEKTPSFSVNRGKQLYHCFGCGAAGNAIGFLMAFNHLDFVEAVEDLAAYAGVSVPREVTESADTTTSKPNLQDLYQLTQQVAEFYTQQLKHHLEAKQAVTYLRSRGLSGEIARDFFLGYAPSDWRNLSKHFPTPALLTAGLLIDKLDGNVYDRFRGRIMFPIRDKRGRVIGFGGRVLDTSTPKYLNSPESDIFHKGKEVYGLYELLRKDAKPRRILVVEGYMDVIALHQFGIPYAVATLGTATSKAHIELLFRFSSELVFCFDGDAAGMEAAWRAMDAALPCLKGGRQVRFMLLPQNTDPDSLVRELGSEPFVEKISAAATLSEYFFHRLTAELNLATIEGKAALAEISKPYLEKLPHGIYREMMFARLQELTQGNALVVSKNPAKLSSQERPLAAKSKRHQPSPLRTAIILLLLKPELAELVKGKATAWELLEMPGIALFRELLERIEANPKATAASLIESFRGRAEERQLQALAGMDMLIPEAGMDREFAGALKRLLEQAVEHQLALLISKEKSQGLNAQEKALLTKLIQKH